MDAGNKVLHPVFRVLAGLLAVCCIFGITMAIDEIRSQISMGHPWGFLAGCIFSGLVFSFAALKGTVPNWLVRQK